MYKSADLHWETRNQWCIPIWFDNNYPPKPYYDNNKPLILIVDQEIKLRIVSLRNYLHKCTIIDGVKKQHKLNKSVFIFKHQNQWYLLHTEKQPLRFFRSLADHCFWYGNPILKNELSRLIVEKNINTLTQNT